MLELVIWKVVEQRNSTIGLYINVIDVDPNIKQKMENLPARWEKSATNESVPTFPRNTCDQTKSSKAWTCFQSPINQNQQMIAWLVV